MDTPVFDALLAEWLARRNGQRWPTVDLDPAPSSEPSDLPTKPLVGLPPEMFREWSEVPHEWDANRSLFRPAVVATPSGGRGL